MMSNDEFWASVYSGNGEAKRPGRISLLRLALLFGAAAITMAIVVPPMLDHAAHRRIAGNAGIDYTTTSSIRRMHEYTERRSVLQPDDEPVCIIDKAGIRSGGC